jgi:hypothetical protein
MGEVFLLESCFHSKIPVRVGARCHAMCLVRGRGYGVGEGLHVRHVKVVKERVDLYLVLGSETNAMVVC